MTRKANPLLEVYSSNHLQMLLALKKNVKKCDQVEISSHCVA